MNAKTGLIIVGVAALSVAGWWGYGKAVPPAVAVVKPHYGPAVDAVYATGTVEPTVMIPLSPKTTARLTALFVDEGQTVKKGDVLAQFEDTDLAATLDQLQAQVDLAKRNLDRKDKLIKRNYISPEAYDQAAANFATAQAAYNEASAKRDYLKLIAPEDATIIRRDGEVGEVISASGDPVFYLSSAHEPLRISSEVDEEDIVHVKIGQSVKIQADAFPDQVFDGKVLAITPKGDSVSRSYRVRIGMEGDVPLMIGMTAETNIIFQENDNALLLPLNSIGGKGEVQKIENGQIHLQKVVLGIEGKDTVEITEGLSEGDMVASPYNPALKDGDRTRVKQQVE